MGHARISLHKRLMTNDHNSTVCRSNLIFSRWLQSVPSAGHRTTFNYRAIILSSRHNIHETSRGSCAMARRAIVREFESVFWGKSVTPRVFLPHATTRHCPSKFLSIVSLCGIFIFFHANTFSHLPIFLSLSREEPVQ